MREKMLDEWLVIPIKGTKTRSAIVLLAEEKVGHRSAMLKKQSDGLQPHAQLAEERLNEWHSAGGGET
jgi:hypothetical protein